MRICPLDNCKTACTENCKYCLEEIEEAERIAELEEDEKYSNGLWDKAADIAVQIGLAYKCSHSNKFAGDEPIYAEDFGQEIIYNLLKGDV